MHRKIFLKNIYKYILIPLIPLLVIGLFSGFLVQHYIRREVDKNSAGILRRASEYMDLILYELDALNYNYDTNINMAIALKRILRSEMQTYENRKALEIIQATMFSQSIKPYIHSFYLYYQNDGGRFVSSDLYGISFVERRTDREWFDIYHSRMYGRSEASVRREIRQYEFEETPIHILSLFKRLNSSGTWVENGVVVMNLDVAHLENVLRDTASSDQQNIVVLNEDNQPVLSCAPVDCSPEEWEAILQAEEGQFAVRLGNVRHVALKRYSLTNDWTYLLLTPRQQQYAIPHIVLLLILGLLVLLVMIEIPLTTELTKKNYRTIHNVIDILEAAEQNRPFPVIADREEVDDRIIQNILHTFIEHSYFKTQLAKRKYHMQVLELLALQSQLNPHFLFNTLHTINWKVIGLTRGPNEASSMIENLSSILEYSLREPNRIVPLREDIHNSRCYVEILKTRYENRFDVLWECDEEMLEFPVPKLVLQPLIENSVYHGIKEKEGPCAIKIAIRRWSGWLEIRVIDNGMGMNRDKLARIRERMRSDEYPESTHLGLMSTNKRLLLHYGEAFSLTIRSKMGWGTGICIRIPTAQ